MSAQIIPVDPFDYVIFGGTGDLSQRKLLPALYRREKDGQLSDPSRLIGASRTEFDHEGYRAFAREALEEHVGAEELDEAIVERFLARLFYVPIDAYGDGGWQELKALLAEGAQEDKAKDVNGKGRVLAYYLAVGPSLYGAITEKLDENGMITPGARIVMEKPIGRDLESAEKLNAEVAAHFDESQIFRIDHYLGKETVQNMLALRFANSMFEPLWNNAHIDHVQITVAETVGVEGRAGYYDKSGAMRDMVQNHLLQLLCLVAMEPPASSHADAMRDEKLKVLRSLKPIDASNAPDVTVKGQYRKGALESGPVDGYLEELEAAGADADSKTGTFVAIKAEIDNWRWAGVPFYMRTGKRMTARMSEIVIVFKEIPHSMFDDDAGRVRRNKLVLRLQPDESVKQWIMIKDPGPGGMRLSNVPLDMSFSDYSDIRAPDAYERLLLDVIRGNQSLFMRRDEVEAAWAWVDPILAAWDANDQLVRGYPAGSWGPSQSIALIERDGRSWNDGDLS